MRHFPLLGSVFRASIHKQQEAEEELNQMQKRRVPSRVGIRVNDKVVPTFPSTSHSITRTSKVTRPYTSKTALGPRIPVENQNLGHRFEESVFNISNSTNPPIIQTQPKVKKAPNTFYMNYLLPNAPPSKSNFVQLEEMLDRLLENCDKNDDASASIPYETVFLEIIRQYNIECSAQGRLLDKCRLFFSSVSRYVPRLKNEFDSQLNQIYSDVNRNKQTSEDLRADIQPMEERKTELSSVIADLKNDYQFLVSHLDRLNTSLNTTWQEVDMMKTNNTKLGSRIDEKKKELIEKNEEMRMLDEVSSKCTQDTINASDKLRELISQESEAKKVVEEYRKEIYEKRKHRRTLRSRIDEIEKAMTEERERIKLNNIAIQADRVQKEKRSSTLEAVKKNYISQQKLSQLDPLDILFTQIENGNLDPQFPSGGVKISSYSDFQRLKKLILKNNSKFQLTPEDIKQAEAGDFLLSGNEKDKVHLLASRISANCIDSAIRKVPTHHTATQTQIRVVKSSSRQSSVATSRIGEKFTKLIPADYSLREPQSIPWMIKNIGLIYDEKFKSDMECIDKRKPLQPLGEFIIEFSRKHNKLDFLADQFCWDVFNGSIAYSKSRDEIKMFLDALLEVIDSEQLCFLLICRDYILKVGAVVVIKSDTSTEQITEFYLSQDQIEPALHLWWKSRYNERFYPLIMNFAVSRPALHLEAMKRYVSMTDILAVMVNEFQVDKLDRMNELLLSTRIVPRIKQDAFNDVMKQLVPTAVDSDLNRFYRATVTKSLNREEVSVEEFSEEFLNGSLLFMHEEHSEYDMKADELLETIQERWDENKEILSLIVNSFEGYSLNNSDDLQFRNATSDAQRYLLMMEHALSIRNAQEACFNYFHLVFSLDALFNMKKYIQDDAEMSLLFIECSIKEDMIDSVFVDTQSEK